MKRYNKLSSWIGIILILVMGWCAYQTGWMSISSRTLDALNTSIDVNARDRFGDTPLMNAVRAGNATEVKRLLQDPNVDLNALSNNLDKDTILLIACTNAANSIEMQAIDVVRMLCEAGADANKGSAVGLRPIVGTLRVAQMGLRMDITKILIEHGAHINAPAIDGGTFLHASVSMNLPEWIRRVNKEWGQIINYEAKQMFSIDRSIPKSYTALELAYRLGHWGVDSMEEAILTRPKPLGWDNDIKVTDDLGRNPLMLAMLRGDVDFAQKIIELMNKKDMALHQVSKDNKTTLMYAVLSDHPATFVPMMLKDEGVKKSINAKDTAGNTALLLVTFIEKPSDRLQVANALKAAGADLSVADAKGRNLKERARRLGDDALVVWTTSQGNSARRRNG